MCGPRHTRPQPKRRKCNTYSCDFHWAVDRWESCTHSCGSQGFRQRQVFCVPAQNGTIGKKPLIDRSDTYPKSEFLVLEVLWKNGFKHV